MSKFNATVYYRLANEQYDYQRVMSTGDSQPPRDVKVLMPGNMSSVDWQFHYQDGVYFLRNFMYNTTYHLGINQFLLSAPRMLRANSELGQQWLIDTWADGTYRFTNRLISSRPGNVTYMGVDTEWNNVLMLSTELGGHWKIIANPSRGVVTQDMLQPFSAIEQPSPATTSSATSSSSSGSSGNGGLYEPGTFKAIDIAGVVVGVFVSLFVTLFLFIGWRRYKKYGTISHRGVPGPTPSPREQRHGEPEIIREPPPAYNTRQPTASFASEGATLSGETPDYYARTSSRRKAADEESIELPAYGRPHTETRSFL